MDLRELRSKLEPGVGMALATCSGGLVPELTDVLGFDWPADSAYFTVFMNSAESHQALQNLSQNNRAAVSLARPCNYFAVQIKGRVKEIRSMMESEFERAQHCFDSYRQELLLIGMRAEAAAALIMRPDTAIEIEITDLFIQTPGPDAGLRMERQ